MEPRVSFITLGVKNLEAMKDFYNRVFGWTPVKDSDGIVFYRLNGFIFALFPADELAEDIGIPGDGSGFRKFSLAVNFHSEVEVDREFQQLISRGATALKKPEKVFWGGYRGYISDVEGNAWELAYNPFLKMNDSNDVTGHE